MTPAIRVEDLGKSYRVNHAEERLPYRTLRDSLSRMAMTPVRRWRAGGHDGVVETFWALRDVSFDVMPGDVVGIIGRNGAGKSTLLKILSQITKPTTGRATIRGRVGSLLEVGTGFHPELTGRENIYMNGSILGMSRSEIKRKFDEIVDFSGVENFLDTPVKRYSSGMQVRLAFAVAANLDPEILIIDEVLAVGDIEFQRKCLGKMQDIAGGGRTVLFVSHNMAAVESLCSKGILLVNGRLHLSGLVDHALSEYRDSLAHSNTQQTRCQTISGDANFHQGRDCIVTVHHPGRLINIHCGDPISICADFSSPKPMRNLTAGLTIKSVDGTSIVSMSSKVQNISVSEHPSCEWHIEADLGRLPLNAGRYAIVLYVGDTREDVARYSDFLSLEVEPKDVYGWGRELPPVQAWGHVYWAPQWTLHHV